VRRRAKIDLNHAEIVAALRKTGHLVESLASQGGGLPDLLVFKPSSGLRLIEVKGAKGTLTPDQVKFQALGWPVQVARTPEEAIQCGITRSGK